MRIDKKIVVVAGAAAVIGAAGAGIAAASGGSGSPEGPDTPITGAALQRASDAALAETGGGRVTGTEVGDEDSYYEIEVTRADGSQVDVQLDRGYAVVTTIPDGSAGGGSGG